MVEQNDYYGMIEAILFANGESVPLVRLAEATGLDKRMLPGLMDELAARYENDPDRGVRIVCLNGNYQMCTKQQYEAQIKMTLEQKRNLPLSQAALECLAVVAYNQPVTKSFVEQVRGVDSSQTVNNLVEKGLLEEAGRLELPGRPIAYRTSDHFLRSFQLSSLQDLPPLPDESGQVKLDEVVGRETGQAEAGNATTPEEA